MSDGKIKKIINISLWIGAIDSIYLSYVKLAHKEALCGGIGQCDVVQASSYSQLFGVPIAILGLFAYITLIWLLANETKTTFLKNNALIIFFVVTLGGFLYSIYLTYIEIDVLHAICPYCVVSAIAITIAFIGSSIRLKRYFEEE
jgi:uncharacterized membrane protein